MGTSVTVGTAEAYQRNWSAWQRFMQEDMQSEDIYMLKWNVEDKSAGVSLFFLKRYEDGLRGRQATAVTASIRWHFAKAMLSMNFLDSSLLEASRAACKLSVAELRVQRDQGQKESIKVPFCEGLLQRMRTRLSVGKSWERDDIDMRRSYLGCMLGFDPERSQEDHSVRLSDLIFDVKTKGGVIQVPGGADSVTWLESTVKACCVKPASHKPGAIS